MVTTPANAWVKDIDATTSTSYTTATTDVECEAACQGISLCQYYIFRADQDPEDYTVNPKLGKDASSRWHPTSCTLQQTPTLHSSFGPGTMSSGW
jgi:hypothetical protein